tara:strand:- start:216 stop:2534 length:2319 start_codon:yes stop_codon:yes gene_type:complete
MEAPGTSRYDIIAQNQNKAAASMGMAADEMYKARDDWATTAANDSLNMLAEQLDLAQNNPEKTGWKQQERQAASGTEFFGQTVDRLGGIHKSVEDKITDPLVKQKFQSKSNGMLMMQKAKVLEHQASERSKWDIDVMNSTVSRSLRTVNTLDVNSVSFASVYQAAVGEAENAVATYMRGRVKSDEEGLRFLNEAVQNTRDQFATAMLTKFIDENKADVAKKLWDGTSGTGLPALKDVLSAKERQQLAPRIQQAFLHHDVAAKIEPLINNIVNTYNQGKTANAEVLVGSLPAPAPVPAGSTSSAMLKGNDTPAIELLKRAGIPIISGTRTEAEQASLRYRQDANGKWFTKEGNPVSDSSSHLVGAAIDVDTGKLTDAHRQKLIAEGWYQPIPKQDPNHWELRNAARTNVAGAGGVYTESGRRRELAAQSGVLLEQVEQLIKDNNIPAEHQELYRSHATTRLSRLVGAEREKENSAAGSLMSIVLERKYTSMDQMRADPQAMALFKVVGPDAQYKMSSIFHTNKAQGAENVNYTTSPGYHQLYQDIIDGRVTDETQLMTRLGYGEVGLSYFPFFNAVIKNRKTGHDVIYTELHQHGKIIERAWNANPQVGGNPLIKDQIGFAVERWEQAVQKKIEEANKLPYEQRAQKLRNMFNEENKAEYIGAGSAFQLTFRPDQVSLQQAQDKVITDGDALPPGNEAIASDPARKKEYEKVGVIMLSRGKEDAEAEKAPVGSKLAIFNYKTQKWEIRIKPAPKSRPIGGSPKSRSIGGTSEF